MGGLHPSQSYIITVVCIIDGIQCPGSSPFINASTANCDGECVQLSAHIIHNVHFISLLNIGKKMGKYFKNVIINKHSVAIPSGANKTYHSSVTTYFDGNAEYTFVVQAQNSGGTSPTANTTG